MKMVKSLILGSAAGLVVMSGAQAADLPVKAKAVEYVRICSLYGAGFFYIPGTDTCIKLGGYLRADVTYGGGIYDAPFWSGDGGQAPSQGNRFTDRFNSRARMALTVDTRTATEYGVVRTFGQSDWQFSTYAGTVNNAAINAAAIAGSLNNDTPGNGYVAVEMAFVQFAGFTFGKSMSAYALPWNGYGGNNNTSFLLGGPDYVTGVNNIQYTAQFGNGVSATISVDEGKVFNRTSLGNLDVISVPAIYPTNGIAGQPTAVSFPSAIVQGGFGLNAPQGTNVNRNTGAPPNGYGGQFAPDIAGNLRIDQAWGIFQISGVAHYINASYSYLDSASNAGAQGFSSPYPAGYAIPPIWGAAGPGASVPGTCPTATPPSTTSFPGFTAANACVSGPKSSVASGAPDSKWGGAITAGLQLKNVPTGVGDILNLDTTYAKGDTKAVISTSGASPSFAMFNHINSSNPTVGFGYVSDGVFGNGIVNGPLASTGGVIQLTTAYGFRGGFIHNWNPYWQSSVFGSWSAVRYNGLAKQAYCNSVSGNAFTGWGNRNTSGIVSPPGSPAYSSTCNPDFDMAMLGFRTGWTPVKNLTFSGEVLWASLHQNWVGATRPFWALAGPATVQTYTFSDQSTVSVIFRVQRNF